MPVSNVEDKLAEGQVWVVEAHLPKIAVKRWLVQIGYAPEGEEPGLYGWHRSQLRHGDLDKYDMTTIIKNMMWLRNNPQLSKDWSPHLFKHGSYELYYMWLLDNVERKDT